MIVGSYNNCCIIWMQKGMSFVDIHILDVQRCDEEKGFIILINLSALKYSWPNLDPYYGLMVFSRNVELNPERTLRHLSAYT